LVIPVCIGILILIATGFVAYNILSQQDIKVRIEFCKEATPSEKVGIISSKSICKGETCKLELTIVENIYCNANENNFKVKYKSLTDKIHITAVFNDKIATRCVCPVKIYVEVSNLERGNYTVVYVLDNKYVNQQKIVDTIPVVLK
jgi:hypothetical protein